jgi:hypothetical protein
MADALAIASHAPPRGLAEIIQAYGDVKIKRDPQGGWRIISPISYERVHCTMFAHPLLPRGRLYVHRKIVEPLRAALELAHERCPDYLIRTIGSFNVRPKRTAGLPAGVVGWPALSFHAVAAAVDINAAQNPMRKPLTTDMPHSFVAAFVESGFTWGGEFPTADPMHFQYASGL